IIAFSLGGAIGPLLGGAILEYFSWGAVFLLSVPVMILLLAVGPFLLPEYRDPNAGKPDVTSAALASAAVLLVIYGLKLIAQDGVSMSAVAGVLAGIAIGRGFVRRQAHLADPFIDLRLFSIPTFRASLVLYGGAILLLFGAFLFLPQYLQLVLGLSPLRGGLWTLPWALGFVLGSLLTPALARRIRPAILMSAGLALSAGGYFLLAAVGALGGGGGGGGGLVLFALATLGGAVVAAQQLPGETGTALLGAAREAFVRGLVLCQMISGIGTLLLAIFAWATFRRAPVAKP